MSRNTAIDYVNRDIVSVKKDIEVLSKLIRDGNGTPSLIQQVTTLNIEMSVMQDDLRKGMTAMTDDISYIRKLVSDHEKSAWQFKTAVILAILSSFTTIYVQMSKNSNDLPVKSGIVAVTPIK